MVKTKRKMMVGSLCFVVVMSASILFSTTKSNLLMLLTYDGEIWNHYNATPAKLNTPGTKEFWASCTHPGTRVFSLPSSGVINEIGAFTEAITPEDDRYVPPTKTATVISDPVVADGVTLDATKFDGGKTAVHLAATATGVDAIGTTFTLDRTFAANEELVFDFRVFSEKGYTPLDPSASLTHDYPWWDKTHPSQAASLYSSDYFNPYMDLKEVTITITSATDPSVWVKCMIRGGAVMRADLSTARVLTSYDQAVPLGFLEDGVGKQLLYGYGAQCDDSWPYLTWDENVNGTRYTEITGAFSNNVITGTSEPSLIKFTPQYGAYDFSGWNGTYYRGVRDCVGNWNLQPVGRDYGYKDMPSGLLADGYKVSITFSDVTANDITSGDISGIHSFNNPGGGYTGGYYTDVNRQYAYLTTAYERHANMLIYSITSNGTALDLSAASFVVD